MRARGLLTLALVLGALLLVATLAAREPISALAPVETVLDGYEELVGVAVAADGTLYVADRGAGVVYRLEPSNYPTVALAGLDHPAGLALDAAGRLLIAEEKAGRVLRLEPDGAPSVLATGIKKPRWLAVSPDGALYVSAHRLRPPDGADENEGREILRLIPGGSPTVAASGLRRLEGLVRLNGAVVAATKGFESGPESAGMLLWYPVSADGSLGAPLTWVDTGLKQPVGLVLDWLGALYVSSKELGVGPDTKKRAVGKVHPDARLSAFAEHLEDPQGVALGPEGSLYLADGKAGRLLRFRAPPAPALTPLPAFTTQSPIPVAGATEPAARVDLFVNDAPTAVTGISDASGAFSLTVALTPNAENALQVLATTHAGDGLTSPPTEARLTHDSVPPGVAFLQPPAGVFVRQTVGLEVEATDGGSGVASLALSKAGQPLAATLVPAPPAASVRASAAWDTTAVADGTHTLTAAATDRAGNSATASRSVFVDNTPPDTVITDGPTGTVPETALTFRIAGSDNLTPPGNLQFAWGLDGGPFFPFSPETRFSLTGLSPGPHTVQVKARDLAGNEDPTPAQRTFTAVALRIQITAPVADTTLMPGLVLVRGTVEAGGAEVGVTVNGTPALVSGPQWAVEIPLLPGSNVIAATATSAAGAHATASITVQVVQPQEAGVVLRASPVSGLAPLTVRFEVASGVARPIVRYELDHNGDGIPDLTTPTFENIQVTYTQPGIITPMLTVTDDQGRVVTTTTTIQVLDQAATIALFQGKWGALKAALTRSDIEGVLQGVAVGIRPRYRPALQAIGGDLPVLAATLGDLQVISVQDGLAETATVRLEDGQRRVYFIYFVPDDDGIWRIVGM
ncbi:MAG: Ig-like domain-containing protein [Actinomycetota bacterium]